MLRKIFLIFVSLLLISDMAHSQTSGILLFNNKGRKFKVTANGVLQNDQPKGEVELCCFSANPVKIKVDFGNDSIVEAALNLKPGFIEHHVVSSATISLDSYEEMPIRFEKIGNVSIINAEGKTTWTNEARQPCHTPISEDAFNEIFDRIKAISLDINQLKEAEFAVRKDCFTANQVKHLLSAFSHESTKLDFAKYAYDFVLNKGGYSVVNEGFSNNTTGEELDKYIESKR